MRYDSSHNNLLKIESIQRINEGLIVMKHFFELNQKLLPIFFELHIKKNKTQKDYSDIEKINIVYVSYNFSVDSSRILLNSDILDYIQQAYFVIQNLNSTIQEKQNALNLFLRELNKLKNNWKIIDAN